jgi:hypothetical protein
MCIKLIRESLLNPMTNTQPFTLSIHTAEAQVTSDQMQHIQHALHTFLNFIDLGGLGALPQPPNLVFHFYQQTNSIEYLPHEVKCSFNMVLPFGFEAFGLLVRMFHRLVVEGLRITDLVFNQGHTRFRYPEEYLNWTPNMRTDLPFELNIQPSSAWINIQCEIDENTSETQLKQLDAALTTWADLVSWGGLQTETPLERMDEPFCASLSEASYSVDQVEWHLQMPDVPFQSLNSLVNILAHCAENLLPIKLVYLG